MSSKLLEAVETIEQEIARPSAYMGQRIRQHLATIRAECVLAVAEVAVSVVAPDPIARAKAAAETLRGFSDDVEAESGMPRMDIVRRAADDVDALVAEAERLREKVGAGVDANVKQADRIRALEAENAELRAKINAAQIPRAHESGICWCGSSHA